MAFDHSRRRWFGTCSCKPVPRGLPSSVKQLRTSSALRLFVVLVAHYCQYLVQVNSFTGGTMSIYGFAVMRQLSGRRAIRNVRELARSLTTYRRGARI